MRFSRISLATLLAAIGFIAVALSCLLYASSAWTSLVPTVTLALLVIAPLGVIYRRGERRAAWLGFGLCGWSYIILSCGPWFVVGVRPYLGTHEILAWAYPQVVPIARQKDNFQIKSTNTSFVIPSPILLDGLSPRMLNGARVDVLVKPASNQTPRLEAEDVQTIGASTSAGKVVRTTLYLNADQYERLVGAFAQGDRFILRPHVPGLLTGIRSIPPVSLHDFEVKGHWLFGLFFGWLGASVGRYFLATQDPEVESEG